MNLHEVSFVSLGPGNPELITLKGLNTLRRADVIYCPATLTSSGKQLSRSADILRALDVDEQHIQYFIVPMSKDRAAAMEAYEKLSTEAAASYAAGKLIAIVAEGDAGFYSSVHYVFEQLLAQGIAVQQVAGIPAFIASGALAGLHIVSQEERLMVIPGNTTAQELSDWLDAGLVVVIMKLSQCREAVKQCMAQYNDHTFHYFENVGTPREVYIRATNELIEKEFPYFSLMIIKKTM